MSQRWQLIIVPLLAIALVAGCAKSPPEGTITGTVTLDGQPLPEGNIQFIPQSGETQTAGVTIKNGQFSLTLPVSKMRVEITASKVVGKKKVYETPESPEVDVVVELIPKRYNVQSDLSIDVQEGPQPANFDLLSK